MRLVLEKRQEASDVMAYASPLIAVVITFAFSAIVFAAMGKPVGASLFTYFIEPLTDLNSLQELAVKATPLVLIAVGLSLCYISNNWNIGAEGQYVMGAVFGSAVALSLQGVASGPPVLMAMFAAGIVGGIAWGTIPALLKVKFGANEILTSLMLVYVAEHTLDYLVRGPWRDPKGYNFPQSVAFDTTVPLVVETGRLHLGAVIALVIVIGAFVLVGRTLKGFELQVVGQAPRAARFAGFSPARTTLFVFAVSGGLAGLAGIIEVAGPIGQLQPSISPGYGFTAIIVAFLGRLNPIGCLIAGLLLALTYIGGESAQIVLKLPLDLTKVIQGFLLFAVLACDSLILYRPRLIAGGSHGGAAHGAH